MQPHKNQKQGLKQQSDSNFLKPVKKKHTNGNANTQKPKLPAGIRRIKIQPKFVDRIGSNTFVPLIMLKGEWLRKIGFECQGHVLIREKAGELVIKLDRDLH